MYERVAISSKTPFPSLVVCVDSGSSWELAGEG